MHIANEAMMRKAQEANAAKRDAEAYEAACRKIQFGTLNAYDVVRLWASSEEPQIENVGARARQIVKEQGLPLSEFGSGRWVVSHIN